MSVRARLTRALSAALLLVAAATGFAWFTPEHPPRMEGSELVLEYELRLPPGFPMRDSLDHERIWVGLVASSRDRAFTTVHVDRSAKADSFVVVPGTAPLRSRSSRSLSVRTGPIDAPNPGQYIDLPLRPRPSRADLEWTPWIPMTRRSDGAGIPPADRVQVRYRVQLAATTPR